MSNIDEQLMNKNRGEEASGRAGKLLEAKRGNASDTPGADNPSAGMSLRERFFKKKKEEAGSKKDGEESKLAEAATAPIRKGISNLLQQAWLNLADSFGLTLLWIDIHVWLGSIVGHKFFCKLGQEWLDNNIVSAENEYAKSQGKTLGTVEPMVLVGCNVGCFVILLSIVMIVAMIVGVITNPLKAISAGFGYLWQYFGGK